MALPDPGPTPATQSGLGIASFLMAIVFGSALVSTILLSGYGHFPAGSDGESTGHMVASVVMAGSLFVVVGAFAMGVFDLFSARHKHNYTWLGVALNGLALVFAGTVFAIGLSQS